MLSDTDIQDHSFVKKIEEFYTSEDFQASIKAKRLVIVRNNLECCRVVYFNDVDTNINSCYQFVKSRKTWQHRY